MKFDFLLITFITTYNMSFSIVYFLLNFMTVNFLLNIMFLHALLKVATIRFPLKFKNFGMSIFTYIHITIFILHSFHIIHTFKSDLLLQNSLKFMYKTHMLTLYLINTYIYITILCIQSLYCIRRFSLQKHTVSADQTKRHFK